ncbi:DUF2238 domain-containing protein [Paenibacillus dauci]|uniref:DUF2238 domain-containing protein n=1 Tax=Paenibacillus dauci TaxID=1567106 RepID=UPI0006199977|nr:DUF2238 domain-containing protein [Paenibacillus dauci]
MNRLRTGKKQRREQKLHIVLLAVTVAVLVWSAIHPHDWFTWILEVFPALIGGAILLLTYRRFQLTGLVYSLIALHMIILMIGGHYTYAEMPLFNWLRDSLHLERNYYDRLGHFIQGFVPAMIVREMLLRTSRLRPGKWLVTIVISICMAISAAYELIEFAVAGITGTAAEAFLGTQGDVWDTQWDMTFALLGAVAALLLFSRYHNAELRRMERSRTTSNEDK